MLRLSGMEPLIFSRFSVPVLAVTLREQVEKEGAREGGEGKEGAREGGEGKEGAREGGEGS